MRCVCRRGPEGGPRTGTSEAPSDVFGVRVPAEVARVRAADKRVCRPGCGWLARLLTRVPDIGTLRSMRVAEEKLKKLCAEKGLSMKGLLAESGVSKNAFYSLARRKNILPHSITAIADTLGISASAFLEATPSPVEKARELLDNVDRIKKQHKDADPDNIRHTLRLLEEKPWDRLRRALTRAQRFDFQ